MITEKRFRLKKNREPYGNCYCRHPELIENYEKAVSDRTQTWEVHHRKEEFYSQKELIEREEYFDVPPEDLIFLTPEEHRKIDSFCKRISELRRGHKLSEETKRKLSETLKNHKTFSKKVLCIETDVVYESTMEIERQTGILHSHISQVCNRKRKTAGGYHWRWL